MINHIHDVNGEPMASYTSPGDDLDVRIEELSDTIEHMAEDMEYMEQHFHEVSHLCPLSRLDDKRNDLLALISEREHLNAARRGAIHLNDQRVEGRFCCLVPDVSVIDRWVTIADFETLSEAEAFTAGYCARRRVERGQNAL